MKKELIKTDNYLLVVDDSKIKEGEHIIQPDIKSIAVYNEHGSMEHWKKIIAHLPLNNSPILEGVPLLPPLEIEVDDVQSHISFMKSANINDDDIDIWIKGYNKAREKYSLSNIVDLYIKETGCGMDMWSKEENETMTTIAKILESLSQPKMPTHFEFEIEYLNQENEWVKYYPFASSAKDDRIKTTTNSQGQVIACGKYVY